MHQLGVRRQPSAVARPVRLDPGIVVYRRGAERGGFGGGGRRAPAPVSAVHGAQTIAAFAV